MIQLLNILLNTSLLTSLIKRDIRLFETKKDEVESYNDNFFAKLSSEEKMQKKKKNHLSDP